MTILIQEEKRKKISSIILYKIVRLIGNCFVPRFVFVCVCVCIWIAHCWCMFLCDNFLCLFHNTSTTTTTTKDNHNEQSFLFILEHNGYKNVWCLCVCVCVCVNDGLLTWIFLFFSHSDYDHHDDHLIMIIIKKFFLPFDSKLVYFNVLLFVCWLNFF